MYSAFCAQKLHRFLIESVPNGWILFYRDWEYRKVQNGFVEPMKRFIIIIIQLPYILYG